jgi:hypothetical protein
MSPRAEASASLDPNPGTTRTVTATPQLVADLAITKTPSAPDGSKPPARP